MLIAAPFLALVAAQSSWWVDSAAAAGGDGSAMAPFNAIQVAVDHPLTLDGDRLWIRGGIYEENVVISGKGLRLQSAGSVGVPELLQTATGVPVLRIVGPTPSPTVLVGLRIVQDDLALDGGGVLIDSASVRMDLCTIEGHRAEGTSGFGGGVHARSSTLRIERSTISGCFAEMGGGGLYADGSSIEVLTSTIRGNQAQMGGGFGIQLGQGSLLIEDCSISNNRAINGSGVQSSDPALLVRRCTITSNGDTFNSSTGGGLLGVGEAEDCEITGNYSQCGAGISGGFNLLRCFIASNQGVDSTHFPAVNGAGTLRECEILNHSNYDAPTAIIGNATLIDCYIHRNRTRLDPGCCDVMAVAQDCDLFGCTFEDNGGFSDHGPWYLDRGGAATNCVIQDSLFMANFCDYGGAVDSCTVSNSVFVRNIAGEGGAASRSTLTNCTFIENASTVAFGTAVESTLLNCIVVGDTPQGFDAASSATWSNIPGGWAGIGNIDANPNFWAPASFGVELLSTSPCIDTGDPSLSDPDGSRSDMGAFPFDPQYMAPPTSFCQGKITSEGCEAVLVPLGSPSASGGSFGVAAAYVPQGTLGIVFLATSYQQIPYVGGELCLAGSLLRRPISVAAGNGSCGGVISFNMASSELVSAGFEAGDPLYLQAFFRDQNHVDGTGLGLTSAVEAVVLP